MSRYSSYSVASSGIAVSLAALVLFAILIAGFVGQPPDISVKLQASYSRGQTGYIAIEISNRYLTRNVTVQFVSISVAETIVVGLLSSPVRISGLHGQALLLPLTLPIGTPVGPQRYVVTVQYAQSSFLNFGVEPAVVSFSGTITIT